MDDANKPQGRSLHECEIVNGCHLGCGAPVYRLNGDGPAHDYYTHALHGCSSHSRATVRQERATAPTFDCDECKGTGWYTGFLVRERCSIGCSAE